MLRKMHAGGRGQFRRGLERWDTSCTMSKECLKTCQGSAGQGSGTQGWPGCCSSASCDHVLNTRGIGCVPGGEGGKLFSQCHVRTVGWLRPPRATIPIAFSPAERGERFGEEGRQQAGRLGSGCS